MSLEQQWKAQAWRAKRKALGLHDADLVKRREYETGRRRLAGIPPRSKGSRPKLGPFMGVDGEGGGRNRKGQQHYMLLRAGPYELFTGKPLTTLQCLNFLCNLPPGPLLYGFAFGYDTTQILRDLPAERVARLFTDKPMGEGKSRYTYFNNYGIEYLPKNYLRVCRVKRVRGGGVVRVPHTTRTIYEAFGNFQMSFLKALQAFDIGREHWVQIERNKSKRAKFTSRMTREIRRYNELECELLAQLMEAFRSICHERDLRPKSFNGAGKLASFMLGEHRVIKAHELSRSTSGELLAAANNAYYGGRFEITRTGEIAGPVWEYDINSAYPAAMPDLPCLKHGEWLEASPEWLTNMLVKHRDGSPLPLFVAPVHFGHPDTVPVCGFPVRQKHGLVFPREGQGVYWSTEIRAAISLGAYMKFGHGWRYVRHCQCEAFDWLPHVYEQRRQLGKQTAGYPLKLGINSLYGKFAQRVGTPLYGNLIWAGLITAHTRARLMGAVAQSPDDILMIATDAIFSKSPLSLVLGDQLGQWESKKHDRLFIVQPGLYWGASKPKTRGVPASVFAKHIKRFERHWLAWCETHYHANTTTLAPAWQPPIVPIRLPMFTGLRLAHARGKLDTSGVWTDSVRRFAFNWIRKRSGAFTWESPNCARTIPHAGGPDVISEPHNASLEYREQFDQMRREYEDQPDHIDLSPP